MLKFLKWTVIVIAVVALGGGAFVFYQIRSLDVERITDDLHLIKGLGGNVAVLKTGAGTVIVDTMTFTMQGTHIRQLAESHHRRTRRDGDQHALPLRSHAR